MAEITINDVKFTNVPNKKAGTKFASALTQSNIGVSQSVEDYMNSANFYTLVNAVDINWNGIEVAANSYINTTSDLIKFILSVSNVDLSDYATMSYVNEKISDVIGAAPETLDTLEELAYALSYNASLSYVQEALSGKANVNDVYTKQEVDLAIQQIELTPGPAGQDGDDGQDGAAGADGKSAYELAVDEGFEGTLSEWLESLHGANGTNGTNGTNGNDGYTPYIDNTTYNWMINGTDTGVCAKGQNGTVDYSVLSSYVSITSYNALVARVEQLASWIVSYHSGYTPTPSGTDPDIYFMNPTMTVDYTMSASMVDGGAMAYPQYLSGSNSSDGAWITWSSSDTTVATVVSGGCITAQGNGTTNISAEYTAHDTYNYKKVEYSLTITNYNSSIEPVDNSFYFMDSNRTLYNSGMDSLYINNNTGIDLMTYPIQWSSSNANITVDQNGVVSWTMTGETATITATLSDGTNTHTATCTVTTAVNKTSPYGNWYEDGTMITQLTLVEGAIDAHDLTFNGTPSDSWTFSGTLPSGISVDSSTGTITVSALSSATAGDYNITGNRMEDSTYWSGMTSFTIKVLPSGTNPQFYYEQQSVNLDNSAMQTQSPILYNEYDAQGQGYDITYSSADTSVATVDAYGMISFVSAGNTTVTATLSNSGNTIATTTINVYCTVNKQYPSASFEYNGTPYYGGTLPVVEPFTGAIQLTNMTPSDGWVISDPMIQGITVYNTGKVIEVQDLSKGQYTINVDRPEDSNYYYANISLVLKVLPSGTNTNFFYDQESVSLDNQAMSQTTPMLYNNTGFTTMPTYQSADTAIATVDEYGMISFVSAGNTTVTASITDGVNTYTTSITVNCQNMA